jgi:4-alpha-glucanotransferase
VSSRLAGVLLHPTSLPGRHGIGELGPETTAFLDFLHETGVRLWQILPLGPTGYGDSPYQCFSAFAGNPLLISLDRLRDAGLLPGAELAAAPPFPEREVDFGPVIEWKRRLLAKAFGAFEKKANSARRGSLERFRAENAAWLPDFALFMALKAEAGGAAWHTWERALVTREPGALERARAGLAREIRGVEFEQWQFFEQWEAVREQARQRGITIMGDIPIFVAQDSADVWSHPEIFHLAADGRPSFQAGVPPDYFSATGQLWGNPLYRWDALARSGYAWWIERLRAVLALVDRVRLDHFRGFEAYWQVPGDAPTAERGEWVRGPGAAFFEAVQAALGSLPIVAASSRPRSRRCASASASRAWRSCSSPSAATRTRTTSCRTATRGTRSSTPGRTTTTRSWAGGRPASATRREPRPGSRRSTSAPSPTSAATAAGSTGTSSVRCSSRSPTPRSSPCRTCSARGRAPA